MKSLHTSFVTTALLASLAGSAMAQMGPGGQHSHEHREGQHGMRAEKMREHGQARHQQHLSELKGKLNLQPGQEAAWKAFADGMPAHTHGSARPERAAMEKASTPERIERMQAQHAQHSAEMKKRADATLALYATLNPEQKKIFDAETAHGMGSGGRRGHH